MKRQGREDYYVRKEPREVTHNAMLVSYSMADVVSSLENKKNTQKKQDSGTVGQRHLLKPECTHY